MYSAHIPGKATRRLTAEPGTPNALRLYLARVFVLVTGLLAAAYVVNVLSELM